MKKLKFTKFLPLALALAMLCPMSFAATKSEETSPLELTLDYFINITKENESLTGTAAFNDDYTQITSITPQLVAGYQLITNTREDKVITVKAESQTKGGSTPSLYQNGGNLFIVLTNGDNIPEATSVTNITGGTASYENNANAIAFALTESATADKSAQSAAIDDPTYTFSANQLKYTLKNGIYHFLYTVGTTSIDNTFSTHDTNGKYRTTITITDASV